MMQDMSRLANSTVETLTTEIIEIEEDLWEKDPTVRREIQEAYLAYQAGQYMTIDEYLATIE